VHLLVASYLGYEAPDDTSEPMADEELMAMFPVPAGLL